MAFNIYNSFYSVFKKLDILILRAFIGPFLATFFIATFVLIMQFMWLYIDDLIGKGLGMDVIGKLVACVAATVVPLALPIAILLSSIMTFGNLGESFELVAIKSAGIPLLRFMRPILVVSVFISAIAFVFANNVIPVANLKLNALKYDFTFSKPAFDIKEGIFYNKIDGYVLKIGRKDKDGPGIYNIMIYEKGGPVQDNLIIAESGIMKASDDKRSLEFTMKKGTRYEERGFRNSLNTDFIRMKFDEYKKVLDLSSFTKLNTPDSVFRDNYKMLTIPQLNLFTDSLKKRRQLVIDRLNKEILPGFKADANFDSGWIKQVPVYKPMPDKFTKKQRDSLVNLVNTLAVKTVTRMNKGISDSLRMEVYRNYSKWVANETDLIPDTAKTLVADMAIAKVGNAKANMDVLYTDYAEKQKSVRLHDIEWHRKFALSAACLVLFLIGAPLGSIIRKGGIGTPLIFAIIFFVLFHLMNTFGEKLVKEDILKPIVGMWLATIVLTPIGVFLTYKAMRDSQLFNKEYYSRLIKKMFAQAKAKVQLTVNN